MPKQQIIPIWGGLNNANSPSATGLVDPVTGQQYNSGGLDRGDYFDLTEKEASSLSLATVGLCHEGRYRWVQVDSGATTANVKTGTVGYIRTGSFAQSVVILTAGSGQTAGTYKIAANFGGGGTGAIIQVIVGSAGTVTSATVLNGGVGYAAPPTFTLVTGGTPGTVAAQLNSTVNTVTSFDQVAAGVAAAIRPVVFLNSPTPGNYTFIQELGLATVLGKASSFTGVAAVGVVVEPTTGGVIDVPTSTTAVTTSSIGLAIDLPVVSNLFKIYLQYVPTVQD
jgi:hypothetical protein